MKRRNKFWSFKKARAYIRRLGLKGHREWNEFCRNKKPQFIPPSPRYTYKDKGWIGIEDWLGYCCPKGPMKKISVNHNYFKKWSPNMAYILGLWFTDGCIHFDKRGTSNGVFSISLHKNDKYLLEKILKEIKSKHSLRVYSDYCSFQITSKQIVLDIIRLGGKPRKSLDCEFPNVPKKYLPDFIRGLWDGDGSVWKIKRNRSSYESEFGSGSKNFIKTLCKVLEDNIVGIRCSTREQKPKKGAKIKGQLVKKPHIFYRLKLGVNSTRLLRNFIYKTKSSLRMERKYKRFLLNGKIVIASQERYFWDFNSARSFVRKLKLKNQREWWDYHKNNKPLYIPINCHKSYQNDWIDWYDWLGKEKKGI